MDVTNDIVLSGLDQTLPMEKAQKKLLERVDEYIQESIAKGNPDIAGNAIKGLMEVSRISGLSLAKLIYTFKYQWDKFDRSESLDEYLADKVGVTKITVKRYHLVWEMLVSGDIPGQYVEQLKLHPIQSLIKIAKAVEQGFVIEPHMWMMLAQAPDPATVGKIIRESIKKKQPKKGMLTFEWSPEEKKLVGWKDGKPHEIHFMFDEKDEICMQIINRLLDGKALEK